MECFCRRRTFPFVRFAIVLGRGPNLTSSGHRIPFCLLQWRPRPLGNMRCLKFPADSTLKGSLLARCRDRCYSPLIYTCPHLFVLRIPLTDWLTNTEGSGVSFVSGGAWDEMFQWSRSLSPRLLPYVAHFKRNICCCFVGSVLRSKARQ